ncbi:NAD-dependent epimerase/dehydratase family protein [Sediminibacillus massiliensis]|uniref:NAD-dependent epimerase/dehydratase family protein n=1 Tax=Sediminibacillus massiliensis TaxID=1926277 RepID=UPI000988429F|nr:NAD-dependent epimerase/dehydratase family protein [Sediminibacillus massiliensis]
MKLLILGGTRFLGRFLVEAAKSKNHSVTLFNRGNNPDIFPEIEQLYGDRDGDLDSLKNREWDAVIDTSGFIPRTVAKSCRVLNHVKHYTYISSQSVYEDPSEPGLNENASLQYLPAKRIEEVTRGTAGPVYEHYGPLKTASEQAAESELPGKVLTIRAGLIVGPHDYTDRLPYWVARVDQGGEVLAPGNPDRQVQLIDARDLAEWIIRLIEGRVVGVFNAVGPDYRLTMGRLLETCKKASGSNASFSWAQEAFLMENKVEPWGEMPLWIPEEYPLPGQKKPWNGFLAVDNRKALQYGLKFRPIEATIADVLEWERNRKRNADRNAGMKKEKEMKLLELWNETVI